MKAQTNLTGGPIIDWVFDPQRQRLYILHVLAPSYRGITVLETPTLNRVALVAGVEDMPLQQASAITLAPQGDVWISEANGLWQMNPNDFSVIFRQATADQAVAGGFRTGTGRTVPCSGGRRSPRTPAA